MGRSPFTARRAITTIVATLAASMAVGAAGAQAIVVNDAGTEAGVALVPSSRDNPLPTGVTQVGVSGQCTDPWLSADLGGPAMPTTGLCYRGGTVVHKNESFAFTWDQYHAYWSQTRGYMEQFLRDVADSSGSLNTPFAVTPQYNDAGGRAENASVYGGGCIDYGQTGGASCDFGGVTGAGHDFPANACTPKGSSFVDPSSVLMNSTCLTDSQLQSELQTMIPQTGILNRTQPGYTPLVDLMLPPGVETCLDAARTLCSTNAYLNPPPAQAGESPSGGSIPAGTYRVAVTYMTSNNGESVPSAASEVTLTGSASTITVSSPPGANNVTGWYIYVTGGNGYSFVRQGGLNSIGVPVTLTSLSSGGPPPSQPAYCSYHSQVNVGGTEVDYVVQPWTVGTGCDEPDAPAIPDPATPSQLSIAAGQRMVSPLSQSQIAAIVNPAFNGWANLDGSEIDDNHACVPLGGGADTVTVGTSSQNPYYLQREFNNASSLVFDPYTFFGCAPQVILTPSFVVPSAIDQGDEVQLDGSATESTLVVPAGKYSWNFGDGSAPATGPSVVHTFTKAGTYTVTLTVTDRGGNTATTSEVVTVLTSNGQTATTPSGGGGTGGSGSPAPTPRLSVHLLLLPESLRAALSSGLRLRVSANQAANGLVSVSISRRAAKRAHIPAGRGATVVIGRGTVSQIVNGTVQLRLGLSHKLAAKLRALGHVTLTVRLALVPKSGTGLTILIAGRY